MGQLEVLGNCRISLIGRAPVAITLITAPAVGAVVLAAAAAALGYSAYKTPQKAAEIAFKAPIEQASKQDKGPTIAAPAPDSVATQPAKPEGPKGATGTGINKTLSSDALAAVFKGHHDQAQNAGPRQSSDNAPNL
ncbi:MAG: hypothetical protein K0Q57_938, partial [Gammaproteobacteria bacterium]|nr:hypothetical protein [Gammaproteobacteria bacterium]